MGRTDHVILDLDMGSIQPPEERARRFRILRLLVRGSFFVFKWVTIFALPFLLLV